MVIRITNYCNMNCAHCMEDSTTAGKHMSKDVLRRVVDFVTTIEAKSLQISGGEPTDHPQFEEYLDYILNNITNKCEITLLSNGENFVNSEETREIIYKFLQVSNANLQITVDPKYYPAKRANHIISELGKIMTKNSRISKMSKLNNKISVVTDLNLGIIPIGRAKTNPDLVKDHSVRQGTSCFNMYSTLCHISNLSGMIQYVKSHSNTSLCKPLVTELGDLKFGEYEECTTIVNLMDYSDLSNIELDTTTIDAPCKSCVNNEHQNTLLDTHIMKHYKGN